MQPTRIAADANGSVAPGGWTSAGQDTAGGDAAALALQRLAALAARLVPDSVCWITVSADAGQQLRAASETMPADLSWHLALARQAAREPCLFADLQGSAARAAVARARNGPFRFFAGTPLHSEEGLTIGALCLLGRAPRFGQQSQDRALLRDLAAIASPLALQLHKTDPMEAAAPQVRLPTEQLLEAWHLARIRNWELAAEIAEEDAALHATFGPVHPEDRRVLRAAIARCLATGAGFDIEFRVLQPDRHVTFARAAGRCQIDTAGVPTKIGGVWQDITERKEAEAASVQAEKLKSIGRLTGGIAHDFNNLLTVISMNLEMLADLVPTGHEFWQYIEPARQAANSGAELTARLLAFAQRQPLRPETVRLDQFLPSLRELAVRTIGGRCTIDLVCAPDIGTCLVDRAQLESALLNLIVNARDAMPAGGRIVIAAVNTTIAQPGADGLAPGEYVSVSVSDEGTGVPPEIMDRVFEPFFTTKPVGKGTGLGLSMVLGFSRQSGGRVEIESKPGQGTSVVLHLPRAAGENALRIAADAGEDWAPLPWRTLVVDDATDVLRAMTQMCREIGLKPTPAGSAEDAIALLHSNVPFDLLLTDVVLPGRFGGVDIAQEGKHARPALRVLFTTGYADAGIVNHGRVHHSSEVLIKPFTRQQLLAALRRVMEQQPA